jgi:TolB protein
MINCRNLLLATLTATLLAAMPLHAQQEVEVDIYGTQAASTIRLAYPFPRLGEGVTRASVETPFNQVLLRDLIFAEIFEIVAMPPGEPTVERAATANAQAFLDVLISRDGSEYVVEVRLFDVAGKSVQMGRRYRGDTAALTRIAHTIANDLLLFFNGKPGIFLSQIAFVSTRSGNIKEVWTMDYDGSNQRQVTSMSAITMNPQWSPDGERLVYTSFVRGTSDIYISHRRGGGRVRLVTGVNLNTSPKFSPDGRQIAFVGAVDGNPDIYVMRDDGTNIRRLTTQASVESTPAWSPTGRQIAFTSGRSGSPQIYIMDAEGTNVRRISYEGEWNDDAAFSPTGDFLAYTSRVGGRFQIRLMNLSTGQSRIIAGEGSNEQPTWSPDGRHLVFMSNRSGRWQIYRIAIDGRGLTQLTFEGVNSSPSWSPNIN